jgi:hypothetical protein
MDDIGYRFYYKTGKGAERGHFPVLKQKICKRMEKGEGHRRSRRNHPGVPPYCTYSGGIIKTNFPYYPHISIRKGKRYEEKRKEVYCAQ